jgi:hypothetical protein
LCGSKTESGAYGLHWKREGHIALNLRPGETNIARLCVLRDGAWYQGWYSYVAGGGYRIGYAESSDGVVWTRLDEQAGIEFSPSGWDSQALAYPYVFQHEQRRYMLYNGNGFGRDGLGMAVEYESATS